MFPVFVKGDVVTDFGPRDIVINPRDVERATSHPWCLKSNPHAKYLIIYERLWGRSPLAHTLTIHRLLDDNCILWVAEYEDKRFRMYDVLTTQGMQRFFQYIDLDSDIPYEWHDPQKG